MSEEEATNFALDEENLDLFKMLEQVQKAQQAVQRARAGARTAGQDTKQVARPETDRPNDRHARSGPHIPPKQLGGSRAEVRRNKYAQALWTAHKMAKVII